GGPGAAGEGAARVALGPPGEIRAEAGGPVRVHALSGFRARASGISLVLSAADPPAGAAPALRSSLLGGDDSATRLVDLDGPARLLLEPRAGAAVEVYTPGDEPLTLRMDRVLGWEASLRAEPGRAAGGGPLAQTVALVRFTGEGRVVAERSGPLRAVELPPGATVAVAAARLHGWRGRVTLLAPGAAEAGTAELLRLSGGGVLLLEGAVPEQDAPSGRFAV
ncbi:MAG: hypothetical protein FJ104_15845, partial [Deltaproteobacteria bacterium]|nr:hypothetical protein [Deltaproteobacteria bacterium]